MKYYFVRIRLIKFHLIHTISRDRLNSEHNKQHKIKIIYINKLNNFNFQKFVNPLVIFAIRS
ncbi:hypothetical protein CUN67_01755 [Pantoea cypripedii]|uniref:Uncharacterized protein n=1 Tax=Pantoea cypripedii TaxID=55209 RepID=A0A6B9FWC5_PANCY|nr:hypothetical protein CUN67_01755 [Pantoea cypripedii]